MSSWQDKCDISPRPGRRTRGHEEDCPQRRPLSTYALGSSLSSIRGVLTHAVRPAPAIRGALLPISWHGPPRGLPSSPPGLPEAPPQSPPASCSVMGSQPPAGQIQTTKTQSGSTVDLCDLRRQASKRLQVPMQKWAKGLNRHFPNGGLQMADEHRMRSASSATRETCV